jgi:raffinose/stachyose/melibiose transport system substrate-binding protein
MNGLRKFLNITVLLILIGSLISACGTSKPIAPAATSAPAAPAATSAPAKPASNVEIAINSWRNEDITLWAEKIAPVFNAKNPGITLAFKPAVGIDYMASLSTQLQGGTAVDVFALQAYDTAAPFWKAGNLKQLNGLSPAIDEALAHVAAGYKAAWSTPDGKVVYGMPIASVMHGIMYNKDIFKQLNLTVPETVDEFWAVMDAVKKDGRYTAMAFGTASNWTPGVVGYDNIGLVYWQGEKGRQDLIAGKTKMTDPQYVAPWTFLAKLTDYMPKGYEGIDYTTAQQLFFQGKAATHLAGSWEIASVTPETVKFEVGIFPPPVLKKGDKCFVDDLTDMAFVINANAKNPEAAQKVVEWLGSQEFATIYMNGIPGFFTLTDYPIKADNPLAQEFLSWRQKCEMSTRLDAATLNAGKPDLQGMVWNLTVNVMNKTITPEEAGKQAQDGLDAWYKP